MKKIALIISLVVFVVLAGNAQDKTLRYGLKLGPTMDWVSAGATVVGNEGLGMGWGCGIVTNMYYTEHIAFSSGLNFNVLGMRYQFVDKRVTQNFLEESEVSVSRRLKAANISIPLRAKVRMDVVDSWKAYVEIGADLGLNLTDEAKDKYEFYNVAYEDESYVNCRNQYRWFQSAIVFGVGAEFEINRKLSLFAQLTFNHAFVNAFTREMERKTGSIVYNNFVGLEVGFLH